MELVTLKQYAETRKVTYESVRRMVNKYREQLAGHIIRDNGTQFLDEEAVAFLSDKRRQFKMVVVSEDSAAKIEELQAEIESLRALLLTSQTELANTQKKLIDAQETVKQAIESNTKYNLLIESHERTQHELDEANADLDRTRKDLDQVRNQLKIAEIDKQIAEKEAGSYHRSFFGFYRKS